jgi:hypothetical protein
MIVGIIHYYICVLLLQNNLGRFLTEIDLYIIFAVLFKTRKYTLNDMNLVKYQTEIANAFYSVKNKYAF